MIFHRFIYSSFSKNIFLVVLFSSFINIVSCSNQNDPFYEKNTQKLFENVIQDAEFAITENNFRITNRLHIGEAIKDRGNDDFPQNEVILFCNLTIAEEMLLIEPTYINYCPYKITIAESKKGFVVGTRLLPVNTGNKPMDDFAHKINNILISMVEYAASDDPFILDNKEEI